MASIVATASVLATADGRLGGAPTAQNIADEIGRARVMPNLRNKVLVMKEASVTLPSDIAPAWEPVDPDNHLGPRLGTWVSASNNSFIAPAVWPFPAGPSAVL
jgi:hypothetical protein